MHACDASDSEGQQQNDVINVELTRAAAAVWALPGAVTVGTLYWQLAIDFIACTEIQESLPSDGASKAAVAPGVPSQRDMSRRNSLT